MRERGLKVGVREEDELDEGRWTVKCEVLVDELDEGMG